MKRKLSKIYLDNGYFNAKWAYNECRGYLSVVGARATGKTYGFLKLIIEKEVKFIYLRRLQTQLDASADFDGNPFKKLNTDMGWNIQPFKKKDRLLFYHAEIDPESGKFIPVGNVLGIGLALSTMSAIKGVDFSDVDCLIFDEFIAMVGERPIKNEFTAFENFVETVARNRELEGRNPLKIIMLANANKLSNPYFTAWGFMKTALKMIKGGQMVWRSGDNSRIMILLNNSPISKKKAETTLYKNASDGFLSMALDNAFRIDATNVQSYSLKECRHIVSVGEIGIYRHKSKRRHYVSETVNRNNYYEGYGMKLKMFRSDYMLLKNIYLAGAMDFENFETELIFREYFDLTD